MDMDVVVVGEGIEQNDPEVQREFSYIISVMELAQFVVLYGQTKVIEDLLNTADGLSKRVRVAQEVTKEKLNV